MSKLKRIIDKFVYKNARHCKRCKWSVEVCSGYACNINLTITDMVYMCKEVGRECTSRDLCLALNYDGKCVYYD